MSNFSRRQFLKRTAAAAGAATFAAPGLLQALGTNEKLQVGFVAVGGRAGAHTGAAHGAGLQCIAFAEVDKTRWGGVHGKSGWKEAAGYTDWRKVFENHGKELDVVFVATPDHTHFAPSMTAVSMGIHCYTEKPLTWSVKEAQLLTAAYKKNENVVTQQGNQGHAGEGWRRAYEIVKSGVIGDIKEFHTWTNRPVWPQGGDRPDYTSPVPEITSTGRPGSVRHRCGPSPVPVRAAVAEDVAPTIRFQLAGRGGLWLRRARVTWRVTRRTASTPSWIRATPLPRSRSTMTGPVKDQYPAGMVVKCTYRAKGDRPGFRDLLVRGEGQRREALHAGDSRGAQAGRHASLPRTGNLVVGTKGKMLVEGDYWDSHAA